MYTDPSRCIGQVERGKRIRTWWGGRPINGERLELTILTQCATKSTQCRGSSWRNQDSWWPPSHLADTSRRSPFLFGPVPCLPPIYWGSAGEYNNSLPQSAKPERSAKKFHQQIVPRIAFAGKINGHTFYRLQEEAAAAAAEQIKRQKRVVVAVCRILYHLNSSKKTILWPCRRWLVYRMCVSISYI